MSSLTSSSAAASLCVVGTLPPSLISTLSQTSHSVVAYLSAELPLDAVAALGTSRGSDIVCSTLPDEKKAIRYTIFEDTVAQRRWTVEMSSSSSDFRVAAETESWNVDVATSNRPELSDKTNGGNAASTATAASNWVSLTGAKYVMQQDTWRETTIVTAQSPPPPLASPATVKSAVMNFAANVRQEAKGSTHIGEIETHKDTATTSSFFNEEGNSSKEAPATLSVEPTKLHNASLTPIASGASSSTLAGLSFADLKSRHGALLRLLVQVLAPQRATIPFVVRKVCTPSTGGTVGLLCEVHDPSSSSSVLRYTETDVAIAVEQLTTPHPRQPKQRELKSEAYLLMNLDGFADGELRYKAVNRAYPALALHWPASAALLDAMERYVDREVVLETRKRHPKLTAQDGSGGKRKRRRSRSSDASNSGSRESSDEEGAHAAIELPVSSKVSGERPHLSLQPQQQSATRRVFQSLHEYPQSLERGNLHLWCDSAEATKVRECLQAATTLMPQAPTSSTAAAVTTSPVSATTLSVLPIANAEDVVVLRQQYDALAAAEETIERHLRDYRDTVRELKAWYREEQCSLEFQSQLYAWVQTQEECRADLVSLHEKVHAVRYRLERDLTDYLHLHALWVL